MKMLLKRKVFYLGFLLALVSILGLNLFREKITASYIHQFGFPFSAYENHLTATVETTTNFTIYDSIRVGHFVWLGLLGNILIGIGVCFVVGYGFVAIWTRFGRSTSKDINS